jgi:quinol monooxygenase YgiN
MIVNSSGSRRVGAGRRVTRVIVVSRFRVEAHESEQFRADLQKALDTLAERPGHLAGTIGRNLDDPTLWVLATTWEHVGAYRRALSSYDVKLHAVPLLGRALDEPSAYEVVEPGTVLNVEQSRSLG